MREFIIGINEAGQRLDKYLKKILPNASSGFLYKMLRKKNITCNKAKMTGKEQLKKGDRIQIFFSEETFMKFMQDPEKLKNEFEQLKTLPLKGLRVVYEDGFASFRPAVCNRLDRNTTGLLLMGKSLNGSQTLSQALKDRTIRKFYRALVSGEIKESAHLSGYLRKDEKTNQVEILEKEADNASYIETAYEPVAYKNGVTELEIHLITGRTHQIRAHLSSIGHPIIGDMKYGDANVNHAFYELDHVTHQLLPDGRIFTAPVPEVFEQIMKG